jgi:hypothetical protein
MTSSYSSYGYCRCRWALEEEMLEMGAAPAWAAFTDKLYSRTRVPFLCRTASDAFLRLPSDYRHLVPGGDASRLLRCCLT